MKSFTDGELEITLPLADVLHHIDDPSTGLSAEDSKVDWAWGEATRYFLCELKDPEQQKAVQHNPNAPTMLRKRLIREPLSLQDFSHVSLNKQLKALNKELGRADFLEHMAKKASDTINGHLPSGNATTYIVFRTFA